VAEVEKVGSDTGTAGSDIGDVAVGHGAAEQDTSRSGKGYTLLPRDRRSAFEHWAYRSKMLRVGTRYWVAFGSLGSRNFGRGSCTMVVQMSGPSTSGRSDLDRLWIVGCESVCQPGFMEGIDLPSRVFVSYCSRRSVFHNLESGRRTLTTSVRINKA